MACRIGSPRGSYLLAALLVFMIIHRAESIPHGWLNFSESPASRHPAPSRFQNEDPIKRYTDEFSNAEETQDQSSERLAEDRLETDIPSKNAGSWNDTVQLFRMLFDGRSRRVNREEPTEFDREEWIGKSSSSSRDAEWESSRNVKTMPFVKSRIVRPFHDRNVQQSQRRLYEQHLGVTTLPDEFMQSDGQIVFPTDDTEKKMDPLPVPVCKKSTFCEKTPYYPENFVKTTIQMQDSLRFLSRIDVVDLVERIDDSSDLMLCISSENVVYPKTAENRQKEWLFVLNQENFTQGVRIETCLNENDGCRVIEGFAEGYKTSCKQKYIYRQLAAIASNGTIITDMFRLPSSCCCHVKFTGNPMIRMGVGLGKANLQSPVTERQSREK